MRRAAAFLAGAAVLGLPAANARADTSDAACIAASDRAWTLRKSGKLLEASQELALCTAAACPDPVRVSCEQRLGDVHAALPTIVFDVEDASGRDVPSIELSIDGVARAGAAAATAIALDPGPHEFVFRAPGQAPVTRQFVLREAEKARHERIVLGETPAPAGETRALDTTASALPARAPAEQTRPWSTTRTVGLALGAAGLAGLAAGGVFLLEAVASKNQMIEDCPSTGCSSPEAEMRATADQSHAKSAAVGATIAFTAGGSALAAGGLLFFLVAPRQEARARATGAVHLAPVWGPQEAGIVAEGTFR